MSIAIRSRKDQHLHHQAATPLHDALHAALWATLSVVFIGALFVTVVEATNIGDRGATVVSQRDALPELGREWVWEKQSPRFDHMWRLPR